MAISRGPVLAHQGQVTLGGWIAALCVTIGVTGSTFGDAAIVPALTYSGMVFLAFSLLIVSLVMPAARIWWALLINLAALAAAVALNPHVSLTEPDVAVVVILSVILLVDKAVECGLCGHVSHRLVGDVLKKRTEATSTAYLVYRHDQRCLSGTARGDFSALRTAV